MAGLQRLTVLSGGMGGARFLQGLLHGITNGRLPGVDTDAEVTVECNPDSVDEAKLRTYRAAGVTRVSLGVQSTQAHVLATLGRTHDRANVARAVDAIHAVDIPTFNLDVIAGAAGESDAGFATVRSSVMPTLPAPFPSR